MLMQTPCSYSLPMRSLPLSTALSRLFALVWALQFAVLPAFAVEAAVVNLAAHGPTALHRAARGGQLDRLRQLLKGQIDINVRDEYGFTPLDIARQQGRHQAAALLEQQGGRSGIDRAMVARLQTYLQHQGYNPGPIDGFMGELTRQAIRDYQQRHRFIVNGEVEEAWVLHLHQRMVKVIQQRLKALGHRVGAIDGVLGPRTRDALRAFQRGQQMAATGRLTSETFHRLLAADAAPPEGVIVTASDAAEVTPAAAEALLAIAPSPAPKGGSLTTYQLQRQLAVLGCSPGAIDGQFGQQTAKAIGECQAKLGLAVTQRPSPALTRALGQELTRRIQQLLQQLGYDPGAIDGDFGQRTQLAARSFQHRLQPELSALDLTSAPSATLLLALSQEVQRRGLSFAFDAPPVRFALSSPAVDHHDRSEISGRLRFRRDGDGQIVSCSVRGVELEDHWCRAFAERRRTDDCRVMMGNGRVYGVKCS